MDFFTILTTKVGVVSADLVLPGVLFNITGTKLCFAFTVIEKERPEI